MSEAGETGKKSKDPRKDEASTEKDYYEENGSYYQFKIFEPDPARDRKISVKGKKSLSTTRVTSRGSRHITQRWVLLYRFRLDMRFV